MMSLVEQILLLRGQLFLFNGGAEAKTKAAYYGETKSDDESDRKEVPIERAFIVGAEAKTEVAYYGQTKSDD